MRGYLRTVVSVLKKIHTSGDPWAAGKKNFGTRKNFYQGLITWKKGLIEDVTFSINEKNALLNLVSKLDSMIEENNIQYPDYLYDEIKVRKLIELFSVAHSAFGGSTQDVLPIDADTPRRFSGEEFLRNIEAVADLMGTVEYVETMLMRIRTLLSDSRIKSITSCDINLSLEKWLEDYICPSNYDNGALTVIDLSMVPIEVIHIITAVIARMTLEALQRYRKLNGGNTLPTTLIIDEAHTFIWHYSSDSDEISINSTCTKVFEKIAREGRKFGLGLVLSSQRPSELSPTVLSQCNTFLLHRISNDRDQDLVNRLVPDNLRGLLRELPSLPSQRAILLGWASELPVMVQMNYLKEEHRPQSNDPDYWNIWTAAGEQRNVDWKTISDDWLEVKQDVATPIQHEEEKSIHLTVDKLARLFE
jgi:hypothetical protein